MGSIFSRLILCRYFTITIRLVAVYAPIYNL